VTCRRDHGRRQLDRLVGRPPIGRPARDRRRSSAAAAAIGWRRTGSLANAFVRIASRSRSIRRAGARGSGFPSRVCRAACGIGSVGDGSRPVSGSWRTSPRP
jgi:hypothetical protein